MSHLEQWISEFAKQAARGGTSLKHYPSLPWLQLTQLGFKLGSTRVSLQSSYRHVRFDLESWRPAGEDLDRLENFPADADGNALAKALQLLQSYKPTALSVSWQSGERSGAWVLRPDAPRQSYPAPHRRIDALMVHISWKPSAVSAYRSMERRHKHILDEYIKRTHFASRPILIQGRQAPSDLDLGHVQSRQHVVAAVMARPQEDALAVAPPIIYNPLQVTYNGSPIHTSEGVSPGLTGPSRVDHYVLSSDHNFERVTYDCADVNLSRKNLDHPELLVAYDALGGPSKFERVALKGTQAYLLPARRVGPTWMVRYSIRPYRASRLFCLPTQSKPGQGVLLPVQHGVCLAPLMLDDLPERSLIVAACPPQLQSEGLRLIEDQACQAWKAQLLEEAHRAL